MLAYKLGNMADDMARMDIGAIVNELDHLTVRSYRSSRALAEFASAALLKSVQLSNNVLSSDLKDAIKSINVHLTSIGTDTSESIYPQWDDLRHWSVVSFQEYYKVSKGGTTDFWNLVFDTLNRIEKESRSLLSKIKEETEKGAGILQTVFVIGGLIAVGVVIKRWFEESPVPMMPHLQAGLLPTPHVSLAAHETPLLTGKQNE